MIRVGPAGWSYADWEGIVYPRKKPAGFHALAFLARYFDCVELNSSFYAPPNPEHAQRWVELVDGRPEFRFTAKLERTFTHERLPESEGELERAAGVWLAGIEPLRASGKLAGILVQFPLSFRWGPSALRRLERIEACFGHQTLVLEVRHRGWFEPEPLEAIERLGYGLARIDLPASDAHPPASAPTTGRLGYLRLHGRNGTSWFARGASRDERYDYLYGGGEVEEIVALTRRIAAEHEETYVITNNHYAGKAAANALEILAGLGREPLGPPGLVEGYPQLSPGVRPDPAVAGPPGLFDAGP